MRRLEPGWGAAGACEQHRRLAAHEQGGVRFIAVWVGLGCVSARVHVWHGCDMGVCVCSVLAVARPPAQDPPHHPASSPLSRHPLVNKQNWELLAEVPLLQHPASSLQAASSSPEQPPHLAPGSVSITWRGDGRYFATASLDTAGTGGTMVRIWERDTAELHSLAQPEAAAAALLPAAAWQPNGRHLYVAAAQRHDAAAAAQPRGASQASEQQGEGEAEQARLAEAEGIAHVGAWKRELRRRQLARAAAVALGGSVGAAAAPESSVLLFERNGLQHGSFDLPPTPSNGSSIEQLAWSPDSEFLAVVLSEGDEDGRLAVFPGGARLCCRLLPLAAACFPAAETLAC